MHAASKIHYPAVPSTYTRIRIDDPYVHHERVVPAINTALPRISKSFLVPVVVFFFLSSVLQALGSVLSKDFLSKLPGVFFAQFFVVPYFPLFFCPNIGMRSLPNILFFVKKRKIWKKVPNILPFVKKRKIWKKVAR